MNDITLQCSLNDTTELRRLILENPELPLIVFVGEDAWDGEHTYSQVDVTRIEIEELTIYKENWMDKDDYCDKLYDDLRDCEEYAKMSRKEYTVMMDDKIKDTEFVKAIVIWIG